MSDLECSNVKLVLIEYRANKVEDLIFGSIALFRERNDFFFINNNIIDSEKQLYNRFNNFSLQSGKGAELLKMFLIINPKDENVEIAPGELCIVESRPYEYPDEYELVHYQMPDYDSIKPWKASDMIVYKIMADTLQIATAIVEKEDFQCSVNTGIISEILGRNSSCMIDVEKVNGFYQPKLKEGKLVICL